MKKQPLTIADIQELHKAGELDVAEQAYLDWLKEHPNDVAALHLLGILYAEEGEFDLAQQYLQQAITSDPQNPALKLHLANVKKANGEMDEGIQLLLEVTTAFPNYAAAYNNLGTMYFAQGKLHDAINAYKVAINIQADYADAYYNMGLAFAKANQTQEAINAYIALITLAPQQAGGRFQLACLLMRQAKYKEAITHFTAIEKHHPYHVETQTNLATCYLSIGQFNDAKLHYLKALELVPKDEQILFNLAVIYMQQGAMRQAIELYTRVIKVNPDVADAHHNLGVAYLALRNSDLALLHFREVLRLQPDNEAVGHTIHILARDKKLSQSPPAYIRSLFNSYADHFDAHLLQALHYQAPQVMRDMLSNQGIIANKSKAVLDLGCGTGLCGEQFQPWAENLVGVDLSDKMLEVAATKNIFNELVCEDLVTYLTSHPHAYDVIVAGDVLVYFGELEQVMSATANALKPAGLFLFNLECNHAETYEMTESGRFAHSQRYMDDLAKQNHFTILQYQAVPLRTQNGEPIMGHFYLLQNMLNFH